MGRTSDWLTQIPHAARPIRKHYPDLVVTRHQYRISVLVSQTPYGRVRLARFARVRLLRHALPISLLILRKKPTVLQSKFRGNPVLA